MALSGKNDSSLSLKSLDITIKPNDHAYRKEISPPRQRNGVYKAIGPRFIGTDLLPPARGYEPSDISNNLKVILINKDPAELDKFAHLLSLDADQHGALGIGQQGNIVNLVHGSGNGQLMFDPAVLQTDEIDPAFWYFIASRQLIVKGQAFKGIMAWF